MVHAYLLLTIAIGNMNNVINDLNSREYVERIDSVTGPCDIIVKIKAKDFHDLKEIILNEIQCMDGIMDCSSSIVEDL